MSTTTTTNNNDNISMFAPVIVSNIYQIVLLKYISIVISNSY